MEGLLILRLHKKFLRIIASNSSYEGIFCIGSIGVKNAFGKALELDEDPTYFKDDIAYHISLCLKHRYDLPSVRISIPLEKFTDSRKYDPKVFGDFCLREFSCYADRFQAENYNRSKTDEENGAIYADHPQGIVEARNSCFLEGENLVLIVLVQLPLKNQKKAARMMTKVLPSMVGEFIEGFDNQKLQASGELFLNQQIIRKFLKDHRFMAFLANGSLLARDAFDKPLEGCIPFQSCPEDEIEIPLPGSSIRGLGIKAGVTVLLGGAYAGKSTILNAILSGVYNHIIGDGREYIITEDSAVKILAEDGRGINRVDVSMFIQSRKATDFSCFYASGSTSQAANIVEAINSNARLLIMDEDSTATNFMICDPKIKELITENGIIPFNERIRPLFDDIGVSTILVIGSCADYLEVADRIYLIEKFQIKKYQETNFPKQQTEICWLKNRYIEKSEDSFFHNQILPEKLSVFGKEFIEIDEVFLNCSLFCSSLTIAQVHAIAYILRYLKHIPFETIEINQLLDLVYERIDTLGIEEVYSPMISKIRFLEKPRKIEVACALNRIRTIQVQVDSRQLKVACNDKV